MLHPRAVLACLASMVAVLGAAPDALGRPGSAVQRERAQPAPDVRDRRPDRDEARRAPAPASASRAIQTPFNMQVGVFDETERILTLAPARQADWARAYASGAGRRAGAREIAAAVRRRFPDDPPAMRAQTALIVQIILMGDVVGALRAMNAETGRSQRRFSREFVQRLNAAEAARSAVIRNFARIKPPRAYGDDAAPSRAARAQNRSARYTQYVQMSTQLMNELQNTERELVDALQTMQRDLQSFWESYASFRDEEFRTRERIMTTR